MCGICGIVKTATDSISERELLQMRDALIHRGPDAAGVYIDKNIGIGHRRLKIIDLSEAAAQPMFNEDGSIVCVFNGEIYNFKSLRAELESKGHHFRSHSDTEVIVHGYEEWGEQCLDRFNGMFAFAIYDQRQRTVLLARDPLGVKPLYYVLSGRRILFSSEIKAFLACDSFRIEVNQECLVEHLLFRNRAGSRTMFRGVESLEPGHWLRIHADLSCKLQRYWDISFDEPSLDEETVVLEERLLALLKDSVALQEVSDVPIGVQLSGGTDSSLVAALMAERAKQPLKTFSVGFDEAEFNELDYARVVARQLHSHHHEIVLNNADFATALEQMSWHRDEPLMHSNSAGIYWLCRQAKAEATVLLTGEGADETFGGYNQYEWLRKRVQAKRWLPSICARLPESHRFRRLHSLKQAAIASIPELIVVSTMTGHATFKEFLDPASIGRLFQERLSLIGSVAKQDWLTQALYYDLKTYLPPILLRQDTMSMAHGVETRVPFLDRRLVGFAFRLPGKTKLHDGQGKWILKRVASRYLPQALLYRKKVGFSFPLSPWLRSARGLGRWLDAIANPNSLVAPFIPRPRLLAMIAEHQQGRRDHADALWMLIALEAWHRSFTSKPPSSAREGVTLSTPLCSSEPAGTSHG